MGLAIVLHKVAIRWLTMETRPVLVKMCTYFRKESKKGFSNFIMKRIWRWVIIRARVDGGGEWWFKLEVLVGSRGPQ